MQFGTFNNTDTCHTLRYFHSTKQCAEILYYNTYVVFFFKDEPKPKRSVSQYKADGK